MLMEVKNQLKVMFLSTKYNIMRQMTNKVTFITNIVFMILNNASFIIQWIILFSIKDEIGGYTIKEVLVNMTHSETGRNLKGFIHRGKQFYHIKKVLREKKKEWR